MSFLYPPRPENAIIPDHLSMFNSMGYSAEYKKNGTCSVIEYDDGSLTAWTRHNTQHKLWRPDINSPSLRKLKTLKEDTLLVGELLHSKGVGHTDTLYLFDILKVNGVPLIGKSLSFRRDVLLNLWEVKGEDYSHYFVDDRLWIAKPFFSGFKQAFDSITKIEDEGLVLKDPNAILMPCFKDGSNSGWQVKCRKPTKNYSF